MQKPSKRMRRDNAKGQDATSEDDAKKAEAARVERLHGLGLTLAQKRSEAIQDRKASGIEEDWAKCEEAYNGIDDANRKEHSAWRTKPPGQIQAEAAGATRSTVFINITAPYVDTAAASMADMLLPTDDRAWSIQPTPVPELDALVKGKIPKSLLLAAKQLYPDPNPPAPAQPQQGQTPQAAPGQMAQPQDTQVLAGFSQQASDWINAQIERAKQMREVATGAAEKAQRRIEDWHVECQFHKVVRDCINDAAKIGTGVIKGPVPIKQTGVMFRDGELIIEEKIVPGSVLVSAWNLFPDGTCGENIHNGAFIWERDELTTRQLHDLKGMDGYLDSQIEECIKEGPTKAIVNPKREVDQYTAKATDGRYEIWYFHGYLDKDDLEACGLSCDGEMMAIPAMITMVNNRVIRASLNPLDSGDFPYDVMPWSKRFGHWAGRGVAEQIRTPQKMVNAGWRSLMDNAGIASGPMLIFRQGVVTPADGVAELRPRKVWTLAEDADAAIAAERAIGVIKVDMMVNELMIIIKEAMSLAEIVTGLPMLLQGQQGRAPDTLGGMQMLNNNSSVVRRRVAKIFDDYLTEPHVRRYYRWLLQYGEDDSEKGEFVVDARGSSALVQRDLQNQAIEQMGALVMNRAFKVDPARWFAELCKGMHLDPKRFQYTDEEFAALPPPAPDPTIQAAQITAKARTDAAAMSADVMKRTRLAELTLEQHLEEGRQQLEKMRIAGDSEEAVMRYKASLADTAMRLRVQQQISAAEMAQANDHALAGHMTDIHKHRNPVIPAPTEPAGRASPGEAFAQ